MDHLKRKLAEAQMDGLDTVFIPKGEGVAEYLADHKYTCEEGYMVDISDRPPQKRRKGSVHGLLDSIRHVTTEIHALEEHHSLKELERRKKHLLNELYEKHGKTVCPECLRHRHITLAETLGYCHTHSRTQ